ncbi:hypothetical protein H5300_20480 [Vibrio sp. SG41-7]|uniref:hypothetical protein n=1 Tax=Vibrio sp. SG41-7 TaxID=2760973 RepID=UPI0016043C28|nr:hypothetical protein [Vibrio sp. SG41-7]MBB1465650.1 hypothetical protein [Vibrio sp. SG41-7]
MINKFLVLAAVASMGVTISDTSRVGWLKGLVEGDVPLAIKEAFVPCYVLYSI